MNKTALVTGSEGFVGRHLVPKLEAAGYDVYRCDPKLGERCRIECPPLLAPLDVIIHLAANIAPIDERSKPSLEHYRDICTDYMMARYVEDHPPRELFIYPSSCAVDTPRDPYAWVKMTGERLCSSLAKQGVPVTILRPFSGYGPDQASTYPFRAILDRALAGERPIRVWGSGQQTRDWIHIDDLTDAFIWAINRAPFGSTPVEIGTGAGHTIRQLAEMISREVNPKSPAPVVPMESKPESSWSRIATSSLAYRFGFRPKITLKEGIRRAVEAHRGTAVGALN